MDEYESHHEMKKGPMLGKFVSACPGISFSSINFVVNITGPRYDGLQIFLMDPKKLIDLKEIEFLHS